MVFLRPFVNYATIVDPKNSFLSYDSTTICCYLTLIGLIVTYQRSSSHTMDADRSVTGITGDVNIDENGDRIADYSLLNMNPETSKFEVKYFTV